MFKTLLRHNLQHTTLLTLLLLNPCNAAVSTHQQPIRIATTEQEKQLLQAAEQGDERTVTNLIEKGVSIHIHDERHQKKPLHLAAEKGHLDILEKLLQPKYKANIDAQDKYKSTPLHLAALGRHIDIIEKLLAKGADTTITNKRGRTPIAFAAEHGHEDLFDKLFDKEKNIDPPNNLLLHFAAYGGHLNIFNKVLAKSTNNINQTNIAGHNALHCAVLGGSTDIVNTLLQPQYKANINKQGIVPNCVSEEVLTVC